MPAIPSLSPEHEKVLWDKQELSMDSSIGLSKSVIFYLIKCFALWQGKELRLLETSHITFGKDDLGPFVAVNLESIPMKQRRKTTKRYDDPANPRSIYKIFRKYKSYVANEGPFLVRPISSIKDFICYSPLPLGINGIKSTVHTLMKEAGLDCLFYGNYSVNLQSIDILRRFGLGSHCISPWLLPDKTIWIPPFANCGPTNCEEINPEISLMISRLLDSPYPENAVDLIQKAELKLEVEIDKEKNFESWISNLTTEKNKRCSIAVSNGEDTPTDVNGNQNDRTTRASKPDSSTFNCHGQQFSKEMPCLSTSSKKVRNKDNDLVISSVSSISENAFKVQVNEADCDELRIGEDFSGLITRKRNVSSQSQTRISSKKKKLLDSHSCASTSRDTNSSCDSKLSFSYDKNSVELSCLDESIQLECSSDNSNNSESLFENHFITSQTNSTNVAFKTEIADTETDEVFLMEVEKKEIDDDLEVKLEEDKDIELYESCNDHSSFALHDVSDSCKDEPSSHSPAIKQENDHDELLAPVHSIPIDTLSQSVNDQSDLKPIHCQSKKSPPISVSGYEENFQNSIFDVQTQHEHCHSSEKGGVENISMKKNSDSSVYPTVLIDEDSQTSVVSHSHNQRRNSDSSVEKNIFYEVLVSEDENSQDKAEFTINLSPPILSPQPSFPCDHFDNDRETDSSTYTNIGTTALEPSSSSSSSSSPSSSKPNIGGFLDNANRLIEGLLKSSHQTYNGPKCVLEKNKGRSMKLKDLTKPTLSSIDIPRRTETVEESPSSEVTLSSPEPSGPVSSSIHTNVRNIDSSPPKVKGRLAMRSSQPTKITTNSISHIPSAVSTSTCNSSSNSNSNTRIRVQQHSKQHSLLRSVLENPSSLVCIADVSTVSASSMASASSTSISSVSSSSKMTYSTSSKMQKPKLSTMLNPALNKSKKFFKHDTCKSDSNPCRNEMTSDSRHVDNVPPSSVSSISAGSNISVKLFINNTVPSMTQSPRPPSSLLSNKTPSSSPSSLLSNKTSSPSPSSLLSNKTSSPSPSSLLSNKTSSPSPSSLLSNKTPSPSSHSILTSLLSTAPSTSSSKSKQTETTTKHKTATFLAEHDRSVNTIFRSLEIMGNSNAKEDNIQHFSFTDIPNIATNAEEKTHSINTNTPTRSDDDTVSNKAVYHDLKNQTSCGSEGTEKLSSQKGLETSAINIGDYFPPGTLIPASSIQILTQQGEKGSEVIMKFGFTQCQSQSESENS